MEMSPHTAANQQRLTSTVLFVSGILAMGIGLAIGFLVHPSGSSASSSARSTS